MFTVCKQHLCTPRNGILTDDLCCLKRKRMPKDPISAGIVLHYHERGWMDEEGMKLWVRKFKVWCTRQGGLLKNAQLIGF